MTTNQAYRCGKPFQAQTRDSTHRAWLALRARAGERVHSWGAKPASHL